MIVDPVAESIRGCAIISALYDANNRVDAYSAIDLSGAGVTFRDVILADELGFTNVPVGLLVEDTVSEEIWEVYRGTRVIVKGPNEWQVDGEVELDPCPFAPGCRTHRGFTTTEQTFHLASGRPFPTPQRILGHSLAAAWATERGARLKASVISFAGPKVGDKAFADFAQQAIPQLIRWVHDPDVVPKVPFNLWPFFSYIHAGPANDFDSTAKLKTVFDPDPIRNIELRTEAWHNIHTYWNALDPNHPILPQFAATP